MAGDDLVQADQAPQPVRQPDIAEAATVAPADAVEANANDIGIIGDSKVVIIGKKLQLLSIPLAVVEGDGALPASFLVMVEFAQIGDGMLTRTGIGADTFDESVVEMFLAILRAAIATQEHDPSWL